MYQCIRINDVNRKKTFHQDSHYPSSFLQDTPNPYSSSRTDALSLFLPPEQPYPPSLLQDSSCSSFFLQNILIPLSSSRTSPITLPSSKTPQFVYPSKGLCLSHSLSPGHSYSLFSPSRHLYHSSLLQDTPIPLPSFRTPQTLGSSSGHF